VKHSVRIQSAKTILAEYLERENHPVFQVTTLPCHQFRSNIHTTLLNYGPNFLPSLYGRITADMGTSVLSIDTISGE